MAESRSTLTVRSKGQKVHGITKHVADVPNAQHTNSVLESPAYNPNLNSIINPNPNANPTNPKTNLNLTLMTLRTHTLITLARFELLAKNFFTVSSLPLLFAMRLVISAVIEFLFS